MFPIRMRWFFSVPPAISPIKKSSPRCRHDQTRSSQCAGHRRGQSSMERRPAPGESAREDKHGGGADPAALDKLSGLLRYVDGDYNDPATFQLV